MFAQVNRQKLILSKKQKSKTKEIALNNALVGSSVQQDKPYCFALRRGEHLDVFSVENAETLKVIIFNFF